MSCPSCHANPCTCNCSCDPENEAFSSALNNLVSFLVGSPVKECVNGTVVWTWPCGLSDDEPIADYPIGADESLLCYIVRLLGDALAGGGGGVTFPITIAQGGTNATTAADARSNLGLGTMAVQDANNVAITGGSITGITDLAIADGGTGASTAASARTNLGVGAGDSPEFAGVNVGAAADTTITRTGAGQIAVEGVAVLTQTNTVTGITNKTFTNPSNTAQILLDGANIDWDMNSGSVATVTLGGNRTMNAPTNLKVGTYILKVIQDGTGSRTLTWNAVFNWPGGTAPTLTTPAAALDIITFFCDGTNLYGAAQLDFS